MATLNAPIQLRTDSSENWKNSSLILLKGEIGIEFSENNHPKIKIGNGLSTWKELDYFSENNLLTGNIDPKIQGEQGQFYLNTSTNNLFLCTADGVNWLKITYTDIDDYGDFKSDGTVAMTGNLNLNNNSIINLKNPVNKTDAATKEYIDNKFSNLPNLDNIVTTESGMEIILPDSAINTPYQLILSEEVTQPALSSCTNLIINRGNSLIEIKWKDPDNIVSDNAATSEWKYTKVIRKINSQPVDINDGTEVVLSSIKNQYSENGFIDLDVDNEKEYYYGFFAINNDEISDSGAFIKADKYQSSSNKGVFGVSWDTTNSSPELTRLTIDTDPNHFVTVNIDTEPVPAVGTGEGSSPFDNYLPWMGMEEYNIVNGEILYKQGEEGFSRSSYDTMVYIPEFWYYIEKIQDNVRFYISSEPRENFSKHPGSNKYISRYEIIENNGAYMSISGYSPKVSINIGTMRTNCASKGNGWQQDDFMCYQARNLLYLVEFANFNSQNMLGSGISGDSAAHNTGETDAMIYHTGRAEGTNNLSAVQYRHIENPYGNVYTFVDGILINEHEVFLCTDPQYYGNEITENYLSTGITTPDSNGYPKDLIFSDSYSWALIPSELGGSTSTYLCDYYYQNSGLRILLVGGLWSNGGFAGFWCFNALQASSWSGSIVGGRSVFIKQNSN